MSSKILTVSIPTFILKKIYPEQLIEKYQNGGFSSVTIHKESVQVKNTIKIIGTSSKDPIYSFRDKNNVTHTVATTNCDAFGDNQSKEHFCEWCRLRFTHQPVGIPVKAEYLPGQIVFYTEGCFCDTPCALADVLRSKGPAVKYQNIMFADCETLLRIMNAKLKNTDEILYPAPHYRLLKRNGGSLEDHEYINRTVQYVSVPGIIIQPAKEQFMKMGI